MEMEKAIHDSGAMTRPIVSILMVARNATKHIDAALLSARAQTLTDIEIIVVDDGSIDETPARVAAHVHADRRVRLISGPQKGLSAVRNVSLNAARGGLAAILDSDDCLHPQHIENLVQHHAKTGAHICVSNMIEFVEVRSTIRKKVFAQGACWRLSREVTLEEFVLGGAIGTRATSLGYCKPLFDIQFLRYHGITYDERLRVGEDFDLVLRMMLAGGIYRFVPQLTYYYRKHAASTSHRLTLADIEGLIVAGRGYHIDDTSIAEILESRLENLEGVRRQICALSAIRQGRWIQALRLAGTHREACRLTLSSLWESVLKRVGLFALSHSWPAASRYIAELPDVNHADGATMEAWSLTEALCVR
ncbi:glycosyltransferase family 2 protein [Novosphingobium resinovorum]|uniref:glycosyltransferase family 2 protein n=1 Tax=Novosphingobium resinovorum TaxID=158500 RepID=UPI002ED205B7|nr:glycosyltransferase family 2 protein [Novosphingobium resinovorum]